MTKKYYIYILASKRSGTLYIGVTNNLERRMYEHKNNIIKGFTEKYNIYRLMYFEETTDIQSAIQREKQLKKWNRSWKIVLIEKYNPNWNDLSLSWIPDQVGNDRINQESGDIAGGARRKLEKRLKRSIVSSKNYINSQRNKLK